MACCFALGMQRGGAYITNVVGLNTMLLIRRFLMRTTQQFSITLPNEMANAVKSKVEAGEYASESEVIRDGLRTLMARDRAVDDWLRQQVGPSFDAIKADPSRAVTARKMRQRIVTEHEEMTSKA